MANKKISQLTSASTPLSGTEVLPIVQGGVTVKATVNNVASINGSPIFAPDILYYGSTTVGSISIDLYGDDYSYSIFGSTQILAPNLITINLAMSLYGSNNGTYGDGVNSPLQIISMPLLEEVGQLIKPNSYPIVIEEWEDLTTIDFSSLRTVYGRIYIAYNTSLATLNLQNLESVDNYIYVDSGVLTSLDLSSLQSAPDGVEVTNCSLLETLDVSSLTTCGEFLVTNCALTEATVDAILYQLADVVVLANTTVDLSGGTNAVPSITGDGYVATLIANGCTVTTN